MFTKNDNFYKILFAIEIALLPMVFCANLIMPTWAVAVTIGIICFVKFWRELFKDKDSRMHSIIGSVASVLEFSVIMIFFMCKGLVNLPLSIVVLVLIALYNVYVQAFYHTQFNDTISSVDFCFKVFEYATLIALAIVMYFAQPVIIAYCAIILSAGVSMGYKTYYGFRYCRWFSRIKLLFRKR